MSGNIWRCIRIAVDVMYLKNIMYDCGRTFVFELIVDMVVRNEQYQLPFCIYFLQK